MAHYIPKKIERRGDDHTRIVVFNPPGTRKHGNMVNILLSLLAKAQARDEGLHLRVDVS